MSQVKHILLAKCYDRKGRLLSQGLNDFLKSHPRQAFFATKAGTPERIYLHAEVSALLKAKSKVHTLTVERYGKQGDMLLARPCASCWLAIKEAKVSKVQYTSPEGWITEYVD